jgi:CPA2 family monovalent cation:H+ antiporter-2
MHGDTQLIATIAISLAAAFAGGLVAARIGLPTIVGYLARRRGRRPVHARFVADAELATQLAEIGVTRPRKAASRSAGSRSRTS